MKIPKTIYIFLILCVGFSSCESCKNESHSPSNPIQRVSVANLEVPEFNSDSAYKFVKMQVDFGPRVPNTPAHDSCGLWLEKQLKQYGWEVKTQVAGVKAYDGTQLRMKNIIGIYNRLEKRRLLLCAHWDTRPFADEDNVDRDKPILGANDGGSGVGILLEIARQMSMAAPSIGLDIIFFDAEDYGHSDVEHSYCLGSQYWSKFTHKKNYRALFGILLDMVGAKNAVFALEGTSMTYAPKEMRTVWDIANQIGYSKYFVFKKVRAITDDHYYINSIPGIPTIDIIHYDENTPTKFGSYWHTHRDNMDIISKATLKAVGQTVLTVIFYEAAKNKLS